ncbi:MULTISPECIES: hypothetical protein [unclassified Streptomyces]|uniref:hypothetical protein n=1 Tax=unclassified Streptomyces TaxID=2593676 RepID=UPI00380BB3D4
MGTRTTEKRTDDEKVPAQADAEGATKVDATTKADPGTTSAGSAEPEDTAPAGDTKSATTDARDETADLDDDGVDDADAEGPDQDVAARSTGAVAAGAGAVVAAGLGLASVTGTWLGTLMAERQTLMGQIKLQSGKATDQISAVYGTPWHTTALVNGTFALLAVIVSAVVLTKPRATWVRAVAWGALALGVLGILISAGMYLDLFGSLPSIPKGAGAGGPAA